MGVCSMAERTLSENVAQAINDFGGIKTAIQQAGVEVPQGTTTSEYQYLVGEVESRARTVGQEEGYADGYRSGYDEGEEDGWLDGYTEGTDDGYAAGFHEGGQEGYNSGLAEGIEQGIEEGKQTQYDEFWDNLQNYGKPMQLWGGFAYEMWNDETFKPKYPIKAKDTGSYLFYSTFITDVYVDVDVTLLTGMNIFYGANKTKRIKKLILKDDGTQTFSTSFQSATALTDITIAGKIGRDINFSYSPLTVKSMISIITALKDYAGDETNRFKHTVKFSSACWEALLNEPCPIDGITWEDYVVGKGWLI